MTKSEFIERINRKQWEIDDFGAGWESDSNLDEYQEAGKTLLEHGFKFEQALLLLGKCYEAAKWENPDIC